MCKISGTAGVGLIVPMHRVPRPPSGTFLWSQLLLGSRERDVRHLGSGQGGGVQDGERGAVASCPGVRV